MTRRGRVAVVVGVLAVVALWSVLIGTARTSAEPVPGVVVTDVAPRLFGVGRMNEDESPYTGAHGGALVDYDGAGVACYADHTATDGRGWFYVMSCEGDR